MKSEMRVAVVTGGARGIGLETARKLHGEGYSVWLVDQSGEELTEAERTLLSSGKDAGCVRIYEADVRDFKALEGLVEKIDQEHGRLDVWVNNAGLARHEAMEALSDEAIDLVIDVNLKGTIQGCRAAFGYMKEKKSGAIINIISTASLRGIPTESVYCSAKWGVRGFTQALQEEAAAFGVRVMAILPGGVKTPFWKDARESETDMEDFLDPSEVAKGVLHCVKQPSSVVTREMIIRSIRDNDFSYNPENDCA